MLQGDVDLWPMLQPIQSPKGAFGQRHLPLEFWPRLQFESLEAMDWPLAFCFFVFVTAISIGVAGLARAHDDGPPGFDCNDDGPFGLPGVFDTPDNVGQWSAVSTWPTKAIHATLLNTGKVLYYGYPTRIPGAG